jgi:DNA-binding GntR family transcriptional regulator
MAAPPRHLTKTEVALQVLRARIQSGQLRPGQRLRVEELAEELEMSPTPIREALRVLQADGAIDYRAHHGIVIAEISVDEIREIYRLRTLLEALAVELAVPRLDADRLATLERLHQQGAAAGTNGGSALAEQNSAWHWTIYDASGSPLLNDFVRRLWEAFPWRTMWALQGQPELSQRQHARIMEEIRRGNAKRAAERMRVHVGSGEKTLLAQLERERLTR